MFRFRSGRAGLGLILFCAMVVFSAPEVSGQDKKASTPPVKGKLVPVPKEEYGDQNGEKVLPANGRAPNTVMRARLEDTFLKLSDPRIDAKAGALLVDYEVVSRGKLDGGFLVLRADDGSKAEIELKSIVGRDSGTIQLVGNKMFGNIKVRTKANFPENMEMFVARGDDRYDPPSRYMVSNAVVMGKMKTATKPRDWTPEEYAKYTGPPLAYKNPNGFPDVGVEVPPQKTGPNQTRYVDPDGRLLGLDYAVGTWDGQQTVSHLHPVFSADQPKTHISRSVARKGYAVAGAEVNTGKTVLGIRLLFQKVKPDGTFDAKDAYAGDWIGTAPTGEPTKLANDGRRVIGIRSFHGAVIDGFSLVVADEKK